MDTAMFPSVAAGGDTGYGTRRPLARGFGTTQIRVRQTIRMGLMPRNGRHSPDSLSVPPTLIPLPLHFAGGARGCTGSTYLRCLREGYIR